MQRNKIFILIFFLATCLLPILFFPFGCKKAENYGLETKDDSFRYCYFLDNSELLIKNENDFNAQFNAKKYQEFVEQVDETMEKEGLYLQPEPLFLPIVQKIVSGNKYVFVFEDTSTTRDGRITKRIALECSDITEKMTIPKDCQGYYLQDAWEWPPAIFDIIKGEIRTEKAPGVIGYISGHLELEYEDHMFSEGMKKTIQGNFEIYNKNRHLFISKPVFSE